MKRYLRGMLYHLSPHDNPLECIGKVFELVQAKFDASHRIAYFNNHTPAQLLKTLRASTLPWTKDRNRMESFVYELVLSIYELVNKLENNYDLIIVEHLDLIVQEHTSKSYSELNSMVTKLLSTVKCGVFIDSWSYLDKYYYWDEFPRFAEVMGVKFEGPKRRP